jgi:hypothetical protein
MAKAWRWVFTIAGRPHGSMILAVGAILRWRRLVPALSEAMQRYNQRLLGLARSPVDGSRYILYNPGAPDLASRWTAIVKRLCPG